ncbi:type II toxin-antitoxin system PemK/MazF family toxin [Nonomuraea sp. SYSU D8015]|uniref:type II toxin-antitoxin system PemK/MazF family toxin n=1 Tax=Nonomuraea sp. SYSU D8015 TaxID=2593644 RepID=UPI001660D6E3|nr:type II toxin-antitoxin system PemK/MazF family toxin [Nonomuraea sp. SYSU D8015]
MIQGEIRLADLGDPVGREQGFRRPVLVVRSVSPQRFTRRIGIAPDEVVREVTDWITDVI